MDSAGRNVERGLLLLGFGPLIVLVFLVAVIAIFTPHFLSGRNISNIFAQTAVIAVVAMGQHLVILTRGIDLSVGSNLALSSVVGALVFQGPVVRSQRSWQWWEPGRRLV
jgi:ribose transport system permease protein